MRTEYLKGIESDIIRQASETAVVAAVSASELVLKYWPNPMNEAWDPRLRMEVQEKMKGTGNYATTADMESEKLIIEMIRRQPLLSENRIVAEESDEIVTGSEWQWVIDPIDGTLPFSNGLPEFGVAIGLLRGHEPQVGVISMPALKQLIVAIKDHGALLLSFDGQTLADLKKIVPPSDQRPDKLLVAFDVGYEDRNRQLAVIAGLADKIGYPVSYCSSSASNFRLALGLLSGFIHQSPTKFDIAAASVIINEVGGKVSSIDGSPIDWSAETQTYLAARSSEVHKLLLGMVQDSVKD